MIQETQHEGSGELARTKSGRMRTTFSAALCNDLDVEGWELTGVVRDANDDVGQYRLFFKRPRR